MAETTGSLELWGGVECTRNRVGDTYHDQLTQSGHDGRLDDLDRFASLGLRALRYPLLWEKIAPRGIRVAAWDWADGRLARLQYLGLRPIVGLVHHGSGPPDTSLVAPDFAPRLAEYAGAVARRYPWVEAYTPINEPLTTARFCGLYGHWYPHARDDGTFVRALLNECRATVLAMRAIRQVNPAAQLVQTDDLGKVHSTRPLVYQADFENERRWLAWDLLCGRVDERHALWEYLRESGAGARELRWFQRNPCPPDIIGVNYYITSERYLDQRVLNFPPDTHGGNGRVVYADVPAVRALPAGPAGLRVLLREAWRRYRRPLAVTECHLACTREEQMRWLWEVWQTAERVRRRGVDVRAVTVWSLLGAFDWASLMTCCAGEYEPGAFDVRSPRPRETGVGRLARALARGAPIAEPVLQDDGWWRRPQRILFGMPADRLRAGRAATKQARPGQPVLITGAAGALGTACSRMARRRGLSGVALKRAALDITDRDAVCDVLDAVRPWAVINAADYARVDAAERDADECGRVNTQGAAILAEECHRRGMRFLALSSDLIFDGHKGAPYVETDEAAPLSVYGRSKANAEREITARCPHALVVRSGPWFGPWDQYNFAIVTLRALAAGRRVHAAGDVRVSPTYLPDLVDAMLDLLIDGECGIWHLANPGVVSWAEFATGIARLAGVPPELVCGVPMHTLRRAAPRPACSALRSDRAQLLPPWEKALERWFVACAGAALARRDPADALPA